MATKVTSPWSSTRHFNITGGEVIGVEQAKLSSLDNLSGDLAGYCVSLSSDGSLALVGAPGHENSVGAVYVYRYTGSVWVKEFKLQPSDMPAGALFGSSCRISRDGTTAVVGAPKKTSDKGAAYVFTRTGTTWSQKAVLSPTDTIAGSKFGHAVSVSNTGDRVAISAIGTQAVYIYQLTSSGSSQTSKLTASDNVVSDQFGNSVDLNGIGYDCVVGAPGKNSAYFYANITNGSITQTSKITSADSANGDRFGHSVSMASDGGKVLIGVPGDDDGGTNVGTAQLFKRNGSSWDLEKKFIPNETTTGASFGSSVSISTDGKRVIVGSPNDNTGGGNAGSAYIFESTDLGWVYRVKLQASDKGVDDLFGSSVAISGNKSTFLVGSLTSDTTAADAGAAYIFV